MENTCGGINDDSDNVTDDDNDNEVQVEGVEDNEKQDCHVDIELLKGQ